MRIAIVGSGISGLAAAWLLRGEHDITLFEADARAGGHSNTVMAGDQPVDTGFIVYNEPNYPRLTRLFSELGVGTVASDMSFAASIAGGRIEWAGDNLLTLFGQRRNIASPSHWRMLRDILRFNRQAKQLLTENSIPDTTLGAYLNEQGFGQAMLGRYLLPMAACIWSTPTRAIGDFPLATFLHFFNNHGLLNVNDRPQWRTVAGGSREYVQRMVAALGDRVQLNNRVKAVCRDSSGGVQVISQTGPADFDQLVFACHADQALTVLADADASERRLLSVFKYQKNRAVLHADTAFMPRRRRVWASWNYLADSEDPDHQRVSLTYWMNRLQSIAGKQSYFVTLNPQAQPADPWAEIEYEHPLFDENTLEAQGRLDDIQGRNRLWFCGAWCGYGFHEDGIASAERVARGLGIDSGW
ncbi:MAG: NAD/FAD-binding protein [Salinisphaeraceae bacterium]|nr:NAD/FAD-binding protein [Salinisphaeraceae bacterium]